MSTQSALLFIICMAGLILIAAAASDNADYSQFGSSSPSSEQILEDLDRNRDEMSDFYSGGGPRFVEPEQGTKETVDQ